MSKLCWLGEDLTFEDLLFELGYSKQKVKRIGLSKKERSKLIPFQGEFNIPKELLNYGVINPKFSGGERPVILCEREALLAVHKPSQVHIHPLSYNEHDNLLSFLREEGYSKYLQQFSNDSLWDGGLLYRLDYETSGLVLLTSSKELYQKVRADKSYISKKVYLAVVEGEYQEVEGVISHHLSTSGSMVKEDESGAYCSIEIKVLAKSGEQTLLEVSLQEGRRHQIRVQLSLLGYPIWGDSLYGAQKRENGLFGLHCYRYQLSDGLEFSDENFWGLKNIKKLKV